MKKRFLAAILILFASASFVKADFNPQINYQGKLANHNGFAVSDRNADNGLAGYAMKFQICTDASSTANCNNSTQWTEIWDGQQGNCQQVPVTGGLFSIMLGSCPKDVKTLSDLKWNNQLYLQVSVLNYDTNSYETLSPPKILGAVPASFQSDNSSHLLGATWASPQSIGSANPSQGYFSGLSIGSSTSPEYTFPQAPGEPGQALIWPATGSQLIWDNVGKLQSNGSDFWVDNKKGSISPDISKASGNNLGDDKNPIGNIYSSGSALFGRSSTSSFQAWLGDNLGASVYGLPSAGFFSDSVNFVALADGKNAINATGPLKLDGGDITTDGSGNLNTKGNLSASGITSNYTLLNSTTQDSIRSSVAKQASIITKQTGALIFYNQDDGQIEVYMPSEDQFYSLGNLSLSDNGTAGDGSVDGVQSGTISSSINSALSALGITISNGVTSIASLTTGQLTANTAQINTASIGQIQMSDKTTGDQYCIWFDKGQMVSSKGQCSTNNTNSTAMNVSQFSSQPSNSGSTSGQTNSTVNSAASFSGNQGINTSLFFHPSAYPNLTISAWIYSKSQSGGHVWDFDAYNGGFQRALAIGNNSLSVCLGPIPPQNSTSWSVPISISQNTWHHVVAVYSTTNVEFYLDGQRYSYGSPGYLTDNDGPLVIGYNAYQGGTSYWNGYIDELEVYNTNLSTSQVNDLYSTQKSGNMSIPSSISNSNLVADYHFDKNLTDSVSGNSASSFGTIYYTGGVSSTVVSFGDLIKSLITNSIGALLNAIKNIF